MMIQKKWRKSNIIWVSQNIFWEMRQFGD